MFREGKIILPGASTNWLFFQVEIRCALINYFTVCIRNYLQELICSNYSENSPTLTRSWKLTIFPTTVQQNNNNWTIITPLHNSPNFLIRSHPAARPSDYHSKHLNRDSTKYRKSRPRPHTWVLLHVGRLNNIIHTRRGCRFFCRSSVGFALFSLVDKFLGNHRIAATTMMPCNEVCVSPSLDFTYIPRPPPRQ